MLAGFKIVRATLSLTWQAETLGAFILKQPGA